MSSVDNPYRLLGLSRSATEQDITTAFRKASLKVHPDRCPNDPDAAAKFGQLIQARDLLLSQTKHCKSQSGAAAAGGGMSWVVTTVPSGSAPSVRTSAAPSGMHTPQPTRPQVQPGSGTAPTWPSPGAPATAWPWAVGPKKQVASPQRVVSSVAAQHRVTSPKVKSGVTEKEQRQKEVTIKSQRDPEKPKKSKSGRLKQPPEEKQPKAKQHQKKEVQRRSSRDDKANAKVVQAEEEDDDEVENDEPECEQEQEEEDENIAEEEEEEEEEDYEEDLPEYEDVESEEDDAVESPASSPAAKRRRTSASKRPKRDNALDGLRAALEDTEHAVAGMPMSNRLMLATVCTNACAEARRTRVEGRHEFHTAVLEMIGETLSGIRDALKQVAQDARAAARQAARDAARKEQLDNTRQACRSELDAARSDVSEKRAELGSFNQGTLAARETEKRAVEETLAAQEAEDDHREDLEQVKQALKTFHALEADGAPAKPVEAKRMLKEVEGKMTKVGVHETLFARVAMQIIPALQADPEGRSSFDESALAAAEGCFSTYIQENERKLEGLTRATFGARARSERAKINIQQAKKRSEAARDALRQAKDVQRECGAALKAAVEAQKQHRQEVSTLVQKSRLRSAALADLEDMRHAFESLVAGQEAQPLD